MTARHSAWLALALGLVLWQHAAAADAASGDSGAGHITGVGGIFVQSKDPKALVAWYRDVLGVKIEAWGGAALRYDAPGHPPVLVWNVLRQSDPYMAPSRREFMLDFAVDDLDAFLAKLKGKGVTILGTSDTDPDGRFAWIMDPDGTKIELWGPKNRGACGAKSVSGATGPRRWLVKSARTSEATCRKVRHRACRSRSPEALRRRSLHG